MAETNISFSRYVRITSGVIGSGGTRQRDLIGRIFTANLRCPTDTPLEFETAADVGRVFGMQSYEYYRAQFYFGWVSPLISRAKRISFARYSFTAQPPMIFGSDDKESVTSIVALGQGSIDLVIGGETYSVQAIDLSTGVSSYSDVADKIQQAMRDQYNENTMFADAQVSYDPTNSILIFTGGQTGPNEIDISQTDLSAAIGWTSSANYVDGSEALPPATAVERMDAISNNYATVLFLGDLTLDQHTDIAQTLNSIADVSYIYCIGVTRDNAESWGAALQQTPGVSLNIVSGSQEDYTDMITMIQVAATDYSRRNATSSFMYREFNLDPLVFSNDDANRFDRVRVNYIGRTQTAGRNYAFYQRGVLTGPSTSPVDQNVYANEIWLKDYAGVEFMNLLRGLSELPANEDGRAYGMNTLQTVIEQAIFNGVISVGKELTNTQRSAVTTLSGTEDAWRQVENIGYWANVTIRQFTADSGVTEYELVYDLIYAKKDTIRSVNGRHALV